MWSDMGGYGWGWMVFSGLQMVLFWVFIILAIVALVKWLGSGSSGGSGPGAEKTALQLLQ